MIDHEKYRTIIIYDIYNRCVFYYYRFCSGSSSWKKDYIIPLEILEMVSIEELELLNNTYNNRYILNSLPKLLKYLKIDEIIEYMPNNIEKEKLDKILSFKENTKALIKYAKTYTVEELEEINKKITNLKIRKAEEELNIIDLKVNL